MENKVQFGLKNVHYSVITPGVDNTFTYAAPKPLPGATELTFETKGDQTDFYADNLLYYTTTTNQGYDGTLTVANITEAFRTEVLGEELEATDKVLTENSNTHAKQIAFLFEFDGDVKATRYVMYNCTVSRPGLTSKTKEQSAEPGTQQLKFTAAPRPQDGIVKTATTAQTTAAVYDAWYTAVYEPGANAGA